MKPGFLHALAQAAAGQAPVPQAAETLAEMSQLHEQLLASVAEREAVRTVPTAPQRAAPVEASYLSGSRSRRLQGAASASRLAGAAGKGTIEEALGEAPAAPGVPLDARGSDTEEEAPESITELLASPLPNPTGGNLPSSATGVGPSLRDSGPSPNPWPDGHPGWKPCPTCKGTGFVTYGRRTSHCGHCSGEGRVPVVDLSKPYGVVRKPKDPVEVEVERGTEEEEAAQERIQAHLEALRDPGGFKRAAESAVVESQQAESPAFQAVKQDMERGMEAIEAALAREAAGEQPLPLEEEIVLVGPETVNLDEINARYGTASVEENTDDGDSASVAREGGVVSVGLADGALDRRAGVVDLEGLAREVPAAGLTYDLPTDLLALPPFCFVAGPAGTGKTFQAKAWAAQNPEGVILAATTGIAAVNLGEGTTINALLRFYDTASLRDAYTGGWLESQFKRLRRSGLQRVVLDETSMLSGDQLTILCRAIDNVNADRTGDDQELGLVLVGDFAQLPPVKEPFAFESPEWERFAAATYTLTTIRRQADRDFVEALQAVRRGDVKTALEFFGDRLEQTTHQTFEGTTILAKNDAVDKYNQLRLDKVKGAPLAFPSSRWGKVRSEWGGPPKPSREWGVPEVLQLKVGALVMVLANRNVAGKDEPPEYLYVNGDLGEIVSAERGCATVVLQRTGEQVHVVPILRENLIPLEPGRRKELKAEGHPERVSQDGKHEVIGAVSYLPLRLAYSTTVHKSQGLSLDQVQVNIRDHFFSQPSMLYVALSRARTAEGLRIVGTPEGFRARCSVDQKVLQWL